MTAENFDTTVIALLDRRPFKVFTVEMVNGHKFEIDHPKSVVIRDGTAVFIGPGKVFEWFDHTTVNRIFDDIASTVNA